VWRPLFERADLEGVRFHDLRSKNRLGQISDLSEEMPAGDVPGPGRGAALATEQPLKAIELKCLECCAWSRPEASRCEITGCPLWAMNWRLFGRRDGGSGGDAVGS
jgi:hypothetical protein